MHKTMLKKLHIKKFRALRDVTVELADHITLICGKNGTSKSSILGIAAQIFSFDKDYEKGNSLPYKQINGDSFKSQYSEHIRISNIFDVPGSMEIDLELDDAYTGKAATGSLELMKRRDVPRPVVRNNSTASKGSNTSRNFTHPVIFLSLKRLYPIADRDYTIQDYEYLKKHEKDFINLTNELLNRSSTRSVGTSGTIKSAVAHGDHYDQDSVSAGEDNAGQIILALMSFRKLKEEYSDYKGGLLLIDEADAGLFPTAQLNLLKILDRESKELNLQVIMTSHSPTLIERTFELSQQYRKKYKTIYLSNTFGDVQVMDDLSWQDINADIHTRTISAKSGETLPKLNVYFEDKEAEDFLSALLYRQAIRKFTVPMARISLGASNYWQLIEKKITEFSEKSIICLDADQVSLATKKKSKTVALLPGHLPPDQLIFEHLYNLPADNDFWKNDIRFTREVFTNSAREIINTFSFDDEFIDVEQAVANYHGPKVSREVFKRFYKDEEFQKLITSGNKPYNPWKHWVECNPKASNVFLQSFLEAMKYAMQKGYSVDSSKLTNLAVNLKKV